MCKSLVPNNESCRELSTIHRADGQLGLRAAGPSSSGALAFGQLGRLKTFPAPARAKAACSVKPSHIIDSCICFFRDHSSLFLANDIALTF